MKINDKIRLPETRKWFKEAVKTMSSSELWFFMRISMNELYKRRILK